MNINQEEEIMYPEKEKAFEQRVKKYLKERGCWVFKVHGDGFQRAGVPDLIVCTPSGKFMGIELKRESGKASPLQLYNIEKINECKGIGLVLKPSGFQMFKVMFEEEYSQ